jgi:uncharacterized iron-regulated membrane protein
MRRLAARVHRWLGLFTAAFLLIAGLTGAIIAWDHELDAWLNPALYEADSKGSGRASQSALSLAAQLEASDPRLRVTYLPLATMPGKTLLVGVSPRIDPTTNLPFPLPFSQVALDPATGVRQAQRLWGEASLARESLLPFLYRLHYSLHLPEAFGVELGVLLMGIVALVWSLDAFVALYISFPNLRSWRKSLTYRFRAGGPKLVFDLHRSSGVWLWALLLMLSVSGAAMNLQDEVMKPLVSVFSTLTPTPFDEALPEPIVDPRVDRATAVTIARREAERRGLHDPVGALFYATEHGTYGVGLFEPGNEHGDGSLGTPWIYVDGATGSIAGALLPGRGSAGDLFMQAQFPLHSGRILGVFGRIMMSLLGLSVAMLSVTGVLIWARKLRARAKQQTRVSLSARVSHVSHDAHDVSR